MRNSNNEKITIDAFNRGYSVDKLGNVFYKNKQRSLNKDQRGYLNFTIKWREKEEDSFVCRRVWVHKLQGYIKFGEAAFQESIHIRHLDNERINNAYSNIGIGSQSDNMMDIPKELRVAHAIKASQKLRRFSDNEIEKIREDKKQGMSYSKLCIKYNTSKGTLSYLFNKAHYYLDK